MVTIDRPRVWSVLLLLTAIMLVHPPSARADRIDIDDPSELGSVVLSTDLGDTSFYSGLISEVRFAAGIYSYIYAIQASPYYPGENNNVLNFSIIGHPLEETWGAIRHTSPTWEHFGGYFNPQHPATFGYSITPVVDGFVVAPAGSEASWTVVYMQSPRLPSLDGVLTYTARGCIDFTPEPGECDLPENIVTASFQRDGFAVPTPEPGTIGLFGLGLAGLAAKLRARHHRRVDPPR